MNPICWCPIALLLALLPAGGAETSAASSRHLLVVCSPGSPGTTVQAQPTMDAFASAVEAAAKWTAGSLGAIYFEAAAPGVERISSPEAAFALVPPSFLYEYGQSLSLEPVLAAIPASGQGETYSLVARKGRVTSPTSLAGWEISGAPGFSPAFVREVLLKDWGPLPVDARITFSSTILGALRRAVSGENLAVLLDRSQAEALPTLPFASSLDTVARSRTLPAALLCAVGKRIPAARAEELYQALLHLPDLESGKEILKTMRIGQFSKVDSASLAEFRKRPTGTKP